MCAPRQLFLIPGALLVALGVIGYALALPGVTIGPATFDAHTLLFASLAMICGYQSIWFAILAKTFAITERILPADPRLERFTQRMPLERGLVLGLVALLGGAVLLGIAVNTWRVHAFGRLNYSDTMRLVVPGVTGAVLGYQTILSFFLTALLNMRRR
jgi:hypothetical protein